ncbi:MAG: metal-dependent transcriptional regulator [Promethearchaeota archaeon]
MFELEMEKNRINKIEEEYLKTIYQLVQKKGKARVSEIAKKLSIQPASVTEMIQKLYKKGFVLYERYNPITLTLDGEVLAKTVVKRHEVLKEFLQRVLGIDKEIAAKDACKMEHVIHPETMTQLMHFLKFIRRTPNCMNWQNLD